MDERLDARFDSWPTHLAVAVVTGAATTYLPVQRWSAPARWALHGGLGLLAGGALALGLSGIGDDDEDSDTPPKPRPGPGATAALAVGLGALVAGVSRGGQAADEWAEGALAARGVRRPRLWMGVAAAGASLAMSVADKRQAQQQRDLDGPASAG